MPDNPRCETCRFYQFRMGWCPKLGEVKWSDESCGQHETKEDGDGA